MSTVPTIRRFLVGGGLVLAGVSGQLLLRGELTWLGAVMLVTSACLFALLFRRDSVSKPLALVRTDQHWTLQDWFTLSAMGLAIYLAVAAWLILDVREPGQAFWQIYLASLITVIVIPAGLVVAGGVHGRNRKGRTALYWVLAIIAAAAVTRLAWLSSLPFGTWYDEAANGLEALRIIREPQYRPVYTDGVNASGHYLFLIVAAFDLFGVSTRSIRLISAAAGIATVAAAYFAGRELFGNAMGAVLALILAVSRWSINFSRLGMYNALTPLFELLTIAFLVRALRKNRLSDYVLAGASLGLGFCFYPAFQLFGAAAGVFLIYVVISQWRPSARFWLGLAAMAISALVVTAPIVKYAYERPESYFARVQNTSLFAGKSPEERIPAFAENLRKHLLMFNVRGDPNGRHNLPGEPMLDPITAALLVFGAALALLRWRQPVPLLLLLWFIMGLMGGVLSLDFEAPQSLRSIAALPAVYMFAIVPLYVLNHEWWAGGGRHYPGAAVSMIVLLLVPSAFYNIDTYFRRQAQDFASWNAFSTPETLTAKYLNSLGPDVSAYVISLYDQHPTVRFLTQGAVSYKRLETTASLPIAAPPNRALALIMDAERRELYEEAVRLYPNAVHVEARPPFGGPAVLYYVNVPASERMRIQGFAGTYTSSADPEVTVSQKDMAIDFLWPDDAPLTLPFTAEWRAVLAAETYGPYQFRLDAPGAAALYIDEFPVVKIDQAGIGEGAVVLPRGLHGIRLTAEGGEGAMRLLWRTPDRETEVLPAWSVFTSPVTSNGLLGKYFVNGEWAGEPALEQIDSHFDMYFHIPPLSRPYTVEWDGKIAVPEPGRYGFGLKSNDESFLFIDGEEIARSPGKGQYSQGDRELTAGLHDIRVRYADRSDHTFISVYWVPPSGPATGRRQILPKEFLFPPQGDYDQLAMPSLADPNAPTSAPLESDQVSKSIPVETTVVASGLDQPVGIVSLPRGIVVTEPGRARVTKLAASGAVTDELVRPDSDFVEPFDLDVDERGNLYVLDSGMGTVSIFDSELQYAGDLPIDAVYLSRARGLAVDKQGNELWIANTPGGQLVRYNIETGAISTVSAHQHLAAYGEAQPVDVLATGDGSLYATDSGVHKLSRYSTEGMRLWTQDIPISNSLHGSHLAAGEDERIFMSEPESGTVVEVDEAGRVLRRWSLHAPDGKPIKAVGVTLDDSGAILVTDVEGGRILRFAPVPVGEGERGGS